MVAAAAAAAAAMAVAVVMVVVTVTLVVVLALGSAGGARALLKRPEHKAHFDETGLFQPRKYLIVVYAWRNGGNNTDDGSTPARIEVNTATDDFEYFKVRAGVKLRYLPDDCTEYSARRPRRPLSHLALAVDEDREPRAGCGYTTWTTRMRVFDAVGRQLHALAHVQAGEQLYVVPAGDPFVWPGGYVGRRLELPYARLPDGSPVTLVTRSLSPRAFFIPRFITDDEAERIVGAARGNLVQSMGLDKGKSAVIAERTSRQAWLDCAKHPFVCELDQRIADTIRMPLRHVQRHSDALQVVYYERAQHYHAHHDWFDPTQHPTTPGLKEGYNRMLTLLFYLRDVPGGGGETVFPRAVEGVNPVRRGEDVNFADCSRGLIVTPRKGAAILWYNMKAPGVGHEAVVDEMSLHGGCDPADGEKWASNKWVYNHQWSARADADSYYEPVQHVTQRPTLERLDVIDSMRIYGDGVAEPRGRAVAIEKQIEFVNRRDEEVTLYWFDVNTKQRHEMAHIAPKGARAMNSFVGHVFVITKRGDEHALARIPVREAQFQYEIH